MTVKSLIEQLYKCQQDAPVKLRSMSHLLDIDLIKEETQVYPMPQAADLSGKPGPRTIIVLSP